MLVWPPAAAGRTQSTLPRKTARSGCSAGEPASPWPASSRAAGSPWPSPAARTRPRPARRSSGTSQATGTTLNSELNTASSTAAAVSRPRIRWALARLRALGGVDGEFTFHNSTGYHTLAFERGTIQSVSGSQVVVRAPDGTTWTWLIVSDTVVRQNGSKTTASALATGQTVFAGGPVVSGAKDARLIVIRPGSGSGSSSSSPVSGPSGTSVS